jgi:hypothetical protein
MSSPALDRNQILSGDLAQFPIVDLIQFLGMSRQNGELNIESRNGHHPTRLHFDKGEVVHAAIGPEEGLSAFYRIIALDKGVFFFRTDRGAPRQSIQQSLHSLLLESVHRRDELQDLRDQLPPDDQVLYLNPAADFSDGNRPQEWRVLAAVNGRRTLKRICRRAGDELEIKRVVLELLRRGLLVPEAPEAEWESLIPLPVPQSQLQRERLYPSRIRTNLFLKTIDGKTDLRTLRQRSNLRVHDLMEDVRLLVDAGWITFREDQARLFKEIGDDY